MNSAWQLYCEGHSALHDRFSSPFKHHSKVLLSTIQGSATGNIFRIENCCSSVASKPILERVAYDSSVVSEKCKIERFTKTTFCEGIFSFSSFLRYYTAKYETWLKSCVFFYKNDFFCLNRQWDNKAVGCPFETHLLSILFYIEGFSSPLSID